MILKGSGCIGCPLHTRGAMMVPDEMIEGAKVCIVGQNPGAEEEAQGKPFIGQTGKLLMGTYMPIAGLERGKVSLANVIRCRVDGSNELPALKTKDRLAEQAIEHCQRAYFRPPESTRLIVVQGNYALYGLTGELRSTAWRGWLLPQGRVQARLPRIYMPGKEPPVLSTIHLAALFHNPEMSLPTKLDWAKVPRILNSYWPKHIPTVQTRMPRSLPSIFSFDTEYTYPGEKRLLRISIATMEGDVYVVEAPNVRPIRLDGPTTIVAHNWPADYEFAKQIFTPWSGVTTDDTMYMNSVLWPGVGREKADNNPRGPGLGQGLDFLGSMHARINRWKHLVELNEKIYSAGDAVATIDVYQAHMRQYDDDPQSWNIYTQYVRPLVQVIARSQAVGMRVNRPRLDALVRELTGGVREASAEAQAAVGWPINLGSYPQVSQQLYRLEGLQTPKGRKR